MSCTFFSRNKCETQCWCSVSEMFVLRLPKICNSRKKTDPLVGHIYSFCRTEIQVWSVPLSWSWLKAPLWTLSARTHKHSSKSRVKCLRQIALCSFKKIICKITRLFFCFAQQTIFGQAIRDHSQHTTRRRGFRRLWEPASILRPQNLTK